VPREEEGQNGAANNAAAAAIPHPTIPPDNNTDTGTAKVGMVWHLHVWTYCP